MEASNAVVDTYEDGATREKRCEKHGAYVQTYCSFRSVMTPRGYWSGSCEPCNEERKQERIARERAEKLETLYGYAHIPRRYMEKDFSNYVAGTAHQKAALKACREYVTDAQKRIAEGACLSLIGPPGIGKTHLLCAMAHGLMEEHGKGVRYTTVIDFLGKIQGNWAWNGEIEDARQFIQTPVLFMDEVWAPVHDRDRESVLALIDARYRECRPTMFASNLTIPQLKEAFGERLVDRLREGGGKVLALDGESHRGKTA